MRIYSKKGQNVFSPAFGDGAGAGGLGWDEDEGEDTVVEVRGAAWLQPGVRRHGA